MGAGVDAHAGEGAEGVVGEDVDAAVVGLEVVDLLLEDEHPEVLADELDGVEGVVEAGAVAREAFWGGVLLSFWFFFLGSERGWGRDRMG